VIALGVAAVMNVGSYFFSDKIALAATGAREVGPEHELYRITARLAQRAGLPMPRVYVSPDPSPNAFATGRGPRHAAVCATEGLLHVLDRDEVAAVMAHELAHVKHRDILIQSVAVTIGSAITVLAYLGMYLPVGGSSDDEGDAPNPLVGLLILILGPIAASVIQMAISRSREYAADTAAAEICGNPMPLATALEKIHAYGRQIPMNVNPAFNSMMIAEPRNLMGAVAGLFHTHPPVEKRLLNLIGRETTAANAFGPRRYAA
jgi:heat shock protein HtpX